MRLLNVRTFRFREWPTEEGRPRYGEGVGGVRQHLRAAIRQRDDEGAPGVGEGFKTFVESFSTPNSWPGHHFDHRLNQIAPENLFF